MKKISLSILVFVFSFNVSAIGKFRTDLNESVSIILSYESGKITDKIYEQKLTECSNKENMECTGILAEYYLKKKSYNVAYPLLLKVLKNKPSNISKEHLSYDLGRMFHYGWGVLQNENKALHYLRIAAKLGNGSSAMLIASIYFDQCKDVISDVAYYSKHKKEFDQNIIRAYAWYKVAKSLPKNVKIKPTKNEVVLIDRSKIHLMSISKLEEANKLASNICSGIPTCRQ
ncbi:Sel1 repeat protein [Legionella steelei]|uniref:Sel1 repeat protein n=1 Tax=Legionella steelei TaxID=947033 RepID=A0A0W0ZII3_9GAMM|nr:SEL1-like repeat protein [Legionella steelei]KTD68882.1 Sel1 repeat protein [Legionella steelei]